MGKNKYPTTTIRLNPKFKERILSAIANVQETRNNDFNLTDATIEAFEMWLKTVINADKGAN